jgi:hypothetical protein
LPSRLQNLNYSYAIYQLLLAPTTLEDEFEKTNKTKEKMDLWCSKHAGKLKTSIMDNMTQRFKEDEDVFLENFLPNLPGQLQNEVKQHISLERLKDVSFFTSINLLYITICPIHA